MFRSSAALLTMVAPRALDQNAAGEIVGQGSLRSALEAESVWEAEGSGTIALPESRR
jgi:hypothetical protein